MTNAEAISRRYNDDGQRFEDESGVELGAACAEAATWTSIRDGGTRYDFEDGSAIVVCDGGWDLGFDGTDCLCWAGEGRHNDDCSMSTAPTTDQLRALEVEAAMAGDTEMVATCAAARNGDSDAVNTCAAAIADGQG